ncbi:hypothetical protein ACE7GA_02325 [Roseomonas sp. CCTCC AB2023176]|uniref:hypothetical protein n=1 Tax=Roseomonas sp. CCTCC AB2023176 TaxID=3342640 RepID=UPI0035D7B8B6
MALVRNVGGALALALSLAACATDGGNQDDRVPLEAATARLPAQAAGFERAAALPAGATPERAQERIVEYATPRRIAVGLVFLYDAGKPEVAPSDVAPEFERRVAEGGRMSERSGRRLVERSREAVPLARGGSLSCATLAGAFGRNPVEWQVCVGAVGGRFIRTEVTMPGRSPPAADARGFARAIADAARG